MIWTEITETDFKLSFVFSVSHCATCLSKTLKWRPEWWSGNLPSQTPPVCLVSSVSHLCLSLCFPLQWSKISSCHSVCQNPNCPFHSDVLYQNQCSTGSSICGCIYCILVMCDILTLICSTSRVRRGTTIQRRRRGRNLEKEAAAGGATQKGLCFLYLSVKFINGA